jgi:hypothetical protein
LQWQVYESRKKTLGEKHPLTLEISKILGGSILNQGFMTKSRKLQEGVLKVLLEHYGHDHKETLMCISQIGKVDWYHWDFEMAVARHREALQGLVGLPPEEAAPEEQILECMEDLAAALRMRREEGDTQEAVNLMRYVVDRRIKIMGKEGALTLLAKARLGQALAARGDFGEAEIIMRDGLEVAIPAYGADHLVILAVKAW